MVKLHKSTVLNPEQERECATYCCSYLSASKSNSENKDTLANIPIAFCPAALALTSH